MQGNVLRKEEVESDNNILSEILFASPLTAINFVAVGVTKFVLTKGGPIIDDIEPVSAMKSIDLSPNLLAMRMQ